jgi:1-acyl-sn-glycerol-3-phosphate acyltransferase
MKENFFNRNLESFYRFGVKIIVHLLYKAEFSGFENIPETGGAIVIANHVSFVDGLIMNAASKRKMRFIIDEGIYNTPIVHYFMKMDRAIPVRPQKDSVKKMLETTQEALNNGELIAIFPEGMITYTGNLNRFKFGIEWIVQQNNVPVIPVALIGLWGSAFSRKYIGSKWRFVPKKFRMKIKAICGKPIPNEKAKTAYLQKQLMKLISENVG